MAAPLVMQMLDLVYPAVTRTLLTFFSCHELDVTCGDECDVYSPEAKGCDCVTEEKGGKGRWLEVDYSINNNITDVNTGWPEASSH